MDPRNLTNPKQDKLKNNYSKAHDKKITGKW